MLSAKQIDICKRTMSANAFYNLALDAVENRKDMSIVRAADGEKKLYLHCRENPTGTLLQFGEFTDDWLIRYGCSGIDRSLLRDRIERSTRDCSYFAPSISGIRLPAFDVYETFQQRSLYVDNFFPNLWNEEQKVKLFREAGQVLLIHGNVRLAALIADRAYRLLGVYVHWIELSNWRQSEWIINNRELPKCPLTIFSAGPASKYIGPGLPGVTLDIGAAMGRWTFESTEIEKRKQGENA